MIEPVDRLHVEAPLVAAVDHVERYRRAFMALERMPLLDPPPG